MSFLLVTFYVPASAQNLLQNPSFDTWAVEPSSPDNWIEIGTVNRHATAKTGSYGAQFSALTTLYTGRGVRSDTVNIAASTDYSFGVSAYRWGTNAADSFACEIRVDWFDGSDGNVGNNTFEYYILAADSLVWRDFTNTVTSPVGAAKATLQIRGRHNTAGTGTEHLNVDDAFLFQVGAIDHFELAASDPNLLVSSPSVRRGTPFNLRIRAKDAGDSTITYTGTATLSASRGTITPSSVIFQAAWNGDTTVSVTIVGDSAVGPDTITVVDGSARGESVVVPLADNRLVINEVLPVDINTSGNVDRDEWIEIYNRSTATVSTSGWLLTDYENDITLPAVSIPSGKHMVVHFRELGTNDLDFADTDGAAHIYPFGTISNTRLSAQDDMGLYSSTTKDSLTAASYVSWDDAGTWSGQKDTDAVGAGLWKDNLVVDHNAANATALAGRAILRAPNGSDSFSSPADWIGQLANDTYVFTEGFDNSLFDTNLTGVTLTLTSSEGSTDTVSIGDRLLVTLTATGGGNAAVRGVTTALVTTNADTTGIVVTLYETANGSRIYNQAVTIVALADSASRDGERWIACNATDTVTAKWVKGGAQAISAVPGPLDRFELSAPANVSNDISFSLTITAKTPENQTKTDYTGTVNLTIASGTISPTSATFSSSDLGQKNVTVTISGAALAPDTITATEAATGETGRVAPNVVAAPAIMINEIVPDPIAIDWDGSGAVSTTADEWIELFNLTNSPQGLANWKLGELSASRVTLADTIEARGYAVIYRKGADIARGYFYDSAGIFLRAVAMGSGALGPLGNTGDRVVLTNVAGDTIDDVTYTASIDDKAYARAWDGAGVFRQDVRPTPGADTPTLPTGSRDTSANMRFRIDQPDTASLNESVTLRVLAVDADGVTVTGFTRNGIGITISGGPTLSTATLDFSSGVCSTSVKFQTSTGTATLVIRFETNTLGYDTVVVSLGVGTPNFLVGKLLESTTLGMKPGSTLQYQLTIENNGSAAADSVVFYDTIPANAVFRDTVATPAGWDFQYCTGASPNHGYYSTDYVGGAPAVPGDVRFIRWRRLLLPAGDPQAIMRFRIILQ